MRDTPLVSVICLCYNHRNWLTEAVQSIRAQTYPNVEIILLDDASSDGSQLLISRLKDKYPEITVVIHEENQGNCKTFNEGFRMSKGDFLVDFAADDVMTPDRIEKQVARFLTLEEDFGVVFTDASYIDEKGQLLYHHTDYVLGRKFVNSIPEGNIYEHVLSKYFISSPTMMIKRAVLEDLNGYDEQLAYEDFDFWVRSSRQYKYSFLNERLTKIRRHPTSMSTGWYVPGDKQLYSTFLVCKKALALSTSEGEFGSLIKRIRYELRQSVFSENFSEADYFYELFIDLEADTFWDRILKRINVIKLPLGSLRRLYHFIKFN